MKIFSLQERQSSGLYVGRLTIAAIHENPVALGDCHSAGHP